MPNETGKYDNLSLPTALEKAWDDPDIPEAHRKVLRLRVKAINPALARVLDRYVASRRANPDWKRC